MALLEYGSRGNDVKSWQTFLINNQYLTGAADGIFGTDTKAATQAFQKANGLTADGIVGSATLSKAGITLATSSSTFPPAGTLDIVFDISHFNGTPDLQKASVAGMKAVFQKATQGLTYVDPTFDQNRQSAYSAGLLFGAYHFGQDADGVSQANHFLDTVQLDGKTLPVLDFESYKPKNKEGVVVDKTMSLEQAKAFITQVYDQTGMYPGLYSGSSFLRNLLPSADEVLSKCWLWLAEYGSHAVLPPGWDKWIFWQYTDGVQFGPHQVPVPGVGPCDRDLFNGTEEELVAFWNAHVPV